MEGSHFLGALRLAQCQGDVDEGHIYDLQAGPICVSPESTVPSAMLTGNVPENSMSAWVPEYGYNDQRTTLSVSGDKYVV